MVLRASEAVALNTSQQNVQPLQTTLGFAGADPNKYSSSMTISSGETARDMSRVRLLESLLNIGSKLAEKRVQTANEDAYLEGAAAVGTGQSEADLQGNPLTKDWKVAGFRDTAARLKLADNEAGVMARMNKLRELSPEDFAKELAKSRAELQPQMQGMSRKAREGLFAQAVMSERSLIKTHGAKHAEFIAEQVNKSITAGIKTPLSALEGAKRLTGANGDPVETYAAATDAAFTSAYTNIIRNPGLDDATRAKFIKDIAGWALENDHQLLYQKVMGMVPNSDIQHLDGSVGPMAQYMSFDDATSLAKAYRTSQERTSVYSNDDFAVRLAQNQAALSSDRPPTFAQYRGLIEEGKARGYFKTPESVNAAYDKFYAAGAKQQDLTRLAGAAAANDLQTLIGMNKTPREGVDAWVEVNGKRLSGPDLMQGLLNHGVNTGNEAFFEKFGEYFQPAILQAVTRAEVDPTAAAAIANTMDMIDRAESAGNTGVRSTVLQGMSDEARTAFLLVRDHMRKGAPPADAMALSYADITQAKSLSPEARRALVQGSSEADTKAVMEIEPLGMFGQMSAEFKSWFSSDAAARKKLAPTGKWFEDETRLNAAVSQQRAAVLQKLDSLRYTDPYLSSEARVEKAIADVASRTIETMGGALVLPEHMDIKKYFGVDATTTNDRIGRSIDNMITVPDGHRAFIRLDASETLRFEIRNKDGDISNYGQLDAREVGKQVEKDRIERAQEFARTDGFGVSHREPARGPNAEVTYNGLNRAGVSTAWALRARGDLVRFEGVRDTVYKDKDGNETIGVGILLNHVKRGRVQGMPTPTDGKYTKDQINATFMEASDAAIMASSRAMSDARIGGEPAFRLLSSIAYQSGTGFMKLSAYQEMVAAMQARDKAAAVAALKKSPVWAKTAGTDRQSWYLNMLERAL